MKTKKIVESFTDKYPLIGPVMWMLSIQYFLIQIAVISNFKFNYSLFKNTISDLGNTACGIYSDRYVCSPLHIDMNASFITLGLFMALGSLLIYQEFKRDEGTFIGFSLMAIAGIGTIIVGVFPENTVTQLHIIGALLIFLLGNMGIILLGFSLKVASWLKYYMIITGFISLVALTLFVSRTYLGIGQGGMERVVAYPQTIWLIIFGLYMSKRRYTRINK